MNQSVWKNRNFLLLWIAGLASSFAISVFLFSQSWYVVKVLDLEASLGLIFIASSVPRLIFMLVGGVVADRFSKKKIMFWSDFTRAILLVFLVAILITGMINIWTFVGFALLFGVLDAFFWSAGGAIMPEIVHKENLTRANSINQMTNQSSFILGPMLGGFLVSFGDYTVAFTTTIILLLTGSILTYMIKTRYDVEGGASDKDEKFFASLKEGIVYVKKHSFLTALFSVTVLLNLFIVGPMQMGMPLFAKNVLHGDSLVFSWLEGSMAGGMLLGSLAVGVLNIKHNRIKFGLTGILFAGIFFALLSFTSVLWQSLICVALFGAMLPMANIPVVSLIQSSVKEEMMGRVMSLLTFSSMGLIPVSLGLTSVVISFGMSIDKIMLIGSVLVCIWIMVVPLLYRNLLSYDSSVKTNAENII
ncbi:MFS transporter [Pseudalkalibacillus caeni]|uniref:MFS transporter n=1 Tax=Exobacillus caeni TaxID=2574798 RepID=A0A5R9F0S4_9BACL|nr:MFS transporter [Pseudalkalibacillus caeni]TLS37232.1 MFS transporter [Pseudalkalibacillus caeni]